MVKNKLKEIFNRTEPPRIKIPKIIKDDFRKEFEKYFKEQQKRGVKRRGR